MPGVCGDDGPSDDQAGRVAELFLADDLAQFFDDSGEHAARLTRQLLLTEERGHRVAVEISDRQITLDHGQPHAERLDALLAESSSNPTPPKKEKR